jgi:hypothetical protein
MKNWRRQDRDKKNKIWKGKKRALVRESISIQFKNERGLFPSIV